MALIHTQSLYSSSGQHPAMDARARTKLAAISFSKTKFKKKKKRRVSVPSLRGNLCIFFLNIQIDQLLKLTSSFCWKSNVIFLDELDTASVSHTPCKDRRKPFVPFAKNPGLENLRNLLDMVACCRVGGLECIRFRILTNPSLFKRTGMLQRHQNQFHNC